MSGSGKIMMGLGGVLLVASLSFIGYGYIMTEDGGDFDPSNDGMWQGKASDTPHTMPTFTTTGSFHYMVYVKDGSAAPNISLMSDDSEEMYKSCSDNSCNVDSGYRQIGYFTIPTNDTRAYTLTITGDGTVYIMEPLQGALDVIGGWMSIAIGTCGGICGLVILLIGLSIKNKKPPQVVVVQQTAPMQIQPQQVVQQVQHQHYVPPPQQQNQQPPPGGL